MDMEKKLCLKIDQVSCDCGHKKDHHIKYQLALNK